MIYRTFDPVLVQYGINTYAETILGLDIEQWLGYNTNVALANEHGDLAMFERQWRAPNTVCGHYFFHSRGKAARTAARQFLDEIYSGPYDVQIVVGLTPVEHRAALWMNRQLGFKSCGTLDTEKGGCEMFIQTKQEWEGANQ